MLKDSDTLRGSHQAQMNATLDHLTNVNKIIHCVAQASQTGKILPLEIEVKDLKELSVLLFDAVPKINRETRITSYLKEDLKAAVRALEHIMINVGEIAHDADKTVFLRDVIVGFTLGRVSAMNNERYG